MKVRNLFISFLALYALLVLWSGVKVPALPLNSDLVALLPAEDPHLGTYRDLKRLRSSEGGFDALVHRREGGVLPIALDFAHFIQETGATRLGLSEAEIENDLHDLRPSLLYLMTEEEFNGLDSLVEERIRQQKQRVNPFYVELDEWEPQAGGSGAGEAVSSSLPGQASALLQQVMNTTRYRMSEDSTTIRMTFYPDFSQTEQDRTEATLLELERLADRFESQHPGVTIHWGGDYVDQYLKIGEIQRDVRIAFFIGIGAILLFMVWYLVRMRGEGPLWWLLTDLILVFGILFSGLLVSVGLYSIWFNEISLLIAIVFSILFGINLDYILHIYAVLAVRGMPSSARELLKLYGSGTRPILISCLTTALAVLTFLLAEFDGFLQVGILFSLTLAVNLLATYLLLPLSPSLRSGGRVEGREEGSGLERAVADALEPAEEGSARGTGSAVPLEWLRRPALALIAGVLLIGGYGLTHVRFDFDFSSLEPRGTQSDFERLKREIPGGPSLYEPSYFLAEDLTAVVPLFRHLEEHKGGLYPEIQTVESFAARFPFDQTSREQRTRGIQALKTRVEREKDHLGGLEQQEAELLDLLFEAKPPVLDSLPGYILNRFFFKDGSLAPLIAVHPRTSLSDGERSMRFRQTSATALMEGKTYFAASTSIIAAGILELLIADARLLFLGPLFAIFLLLMGLQRSLLMPLISMMPLVITAGGLSGLMLVTNLNLNLYNVIALPILIGVGTDNGIHLADAIRRHGSGFLRPFLLEKLPVLSACSFTTILGFAGLLFIDYPGLESLGWLSLAGVSLTLVSTLLWALVLDSWSGRTGWLGRAE